MINFKEVIRAMFDYETPKIVTIRSTVGFISRFMQFVIILYILGYAIIYRKGYQEISNIESAVTTKAKGVACTNYPDSEFKPYLKNIDVYRRIWDVADYVVPPSQTNSIFITTNVHITPNQTRSVCAEDITIRGARCDPNNNTCVAGTSLVTGNGVLTGKCVPFEKSGNFSCQIHAWCPVENDILPLIDDKPLLAAAENFTILIKNYVFFPKFKNSNLRNIREHRSRYYLQNCRYHPVKNNDCPIFIVGDIVKAASFNSKTFAQLGSKGAVIEIRITWNCDLDWSKDYCFPTYEFVEFDDTKVKLGKGYNFRYADYFKDGTRTMHKMYGIKFAILVQGQAGKFGILPLLQNMGAGVGLFVVQRVLCDILVLYLVRKGSYYKSKKYETVVVDRDAIGINSQPLPHSEHVTEPLQDSSDTQLVTDSSNPKFATDRSDPHRVIGKPGFSKTTGKPSNSSHKEADKHSFLKTTRKYNW